MSSYAIGDTVWVASTRTKTRHEPCPDCLGQLALTVIVGDGSQVSIPCAGCTRGYEPPHGYVEVHESAREVIQVEITRVTSEREKGTTKIEYQSGCSIYHEENVFASEDEARRRSDEIAKEQEAENARRREDKEHRNHTWAWHVTYHRRCIKDAEKQLKFHTEQLAVAQRKAKMPELARGNLT